MVTATRPTPDTLREQIDALVAHHSVVEHNRYTTWFATGAATRGEIRHLAVQFSVFSHLFVEAQLRKHDKVEDQHAAHTADEAEEAFTQPWFDAEAFLLGASRMLDGVQAFWDGLWADHEAGVER